MKNRSIYSIRSHRTQEENPAVPAVAARGGNNPRAAVAEIPPSGCAMDKRRWYSEEEREQAGGPFDVHAESAR